MHYEENKERQLGMASRDFSGFVLDPAKCSRLSLMEKRELVHEIARWAKDAPEILSSFTRRELLEIICAEMGKQRKYTGYTKFQMIEVLLKLVNQNSNSNADCPAKSATLTGYKRQRQKESQLHLLTDIDVVSLQSDRADEAKTKVCRNVACKATLCSDDVFCRRCSCCICHYYDDNKDPSLWLTCDSDSLDDKSCGHTCHLICALKDGRTGIMKSNCGVKLDGAFRCVSCGKVNDLMRTCRKQLLIAKEARRVDVLCLRVLVAYKILTGTKKYKEMLKIIETAFVMLKNELGTLDLVCAKMARGIVNRLCCGAEVQRLCASLVEDFDLMFSNSASDFAEKKEQASCQIRFEESSPTSVVLVLQNVDNTSEDFVGGKLWHRKATVKDYPEKPSFIILKPEHRFKITDLSPSTEYFFKVSLFSSTRIFSVWEDRWITPPSMESFATALGAHQKYENAVRSHICSQKKPANASDITMAIGDHLMQQQLVTDVEKNKNEGLSSPPLSTEALSLISLGPLSPPTPCKANEAVDISHVSNKKRNEESVYEYSVRVIKWLEHEGLIDGDFRVKFLTWFSLKANKQERRVVNAFIDAFGDDPPNLAGQLVHTFMDEICCEQKRVPQRGFCARLWH